MSQGRDLNKSCHSDPHRTAVSHCRTTEQKNHEQIQGSRNKWQHSEKPTIHSTGPNSENPLSQSCPFYHTPNPGAPGCHVYKKRETLETWALTWSRKNLTRHSHSLEELWLKEKVWARWAPHGLPSTQPQGGPGSQTPYLFAVRASCLPFLPVERKQPIRNHGSHEPQGTFPSCDSRHRKGSGHMRKGAVQGLNHLKLSFWRSVLNRDLQFHAQWSQWSTCPLFSMCFMVE
jgi:hypothetical protein